MKRDFHNGPSAPATSGTTALMRFSSQLLSIALTGLACCAFIAAAALGGDKGPEPGSARWHFERAMVYVIDESKQADAELRAAISKKEDYSEAHYLLGTRLADRGDYTGAEQEFRKVIQYSSSDHLPARIGFAYAIFQQGDGRRALNELLPAAKTIDHEAFLLEIERLQTAGLQEKTPAGQAATKGQIEELFERLDDFLKASPETYRKFTFDRDLNDATVIFDLASMYEEGDNPGEFLKFLREAIKRRDDFSPISLISYSRVLKSRKEYGQAAELLEKAIDQLKQLGFEDGKEFDSRELSELKKLAGKS